MTAIYWGINLLKWIFNSSPALIRHLAVAEEDP